MATIVEKKRNSISPKWRSAVPTAVLIVGWFLIGWFARAWLAPSENSEISLLKQAASVIQAKYYGTLPSARQMTYAAIRGLVSSVGDPYAAFYGPPQAANNRTELRGNSGVIGVKGEMRAGEFVFTQITPGGNAEAAGLQTGDALLQVDGWQVQADSEYMDVMTMIRGPLDSNAQLVVRRGEQTLNFSIPRQPIQETVTQILEGGVVYLRFDQFTEKTPQAIQETLQPLLAKNPPGLVVDLRYNGGGLIESTQAVLDIFLGQGMAFYARTRDGSLLPYQTSDGGIGEKIPLAVVIGPNTYSAPEIMAASLSDRKRATLFGEATHGKGVIRETVFLSDGSSILITVAEWLSPIHQLSYDGRGVPPDVIVTPRPGVEDDAVLQAALNFLRQSP